jgi:hypothetical protein
MEQLDVAYSNPLVLGLHHHAQGMELTKLQLKSFEAGRYQYIQPDFEKF